MENRVRSPLRFLAPLALALATVVFLFVVASAIVGGDEEGQGTQAAEQVDGGAGGNQGGGQPEQQSYEVQEGDTLDSIAADTGVTVDELLELNPDLDPQSLIAGQELQLRE